MCRNYNPELTIAVVSGLIEQVQFKKNKKIKHFSVDIDKRQQIDNRTTVNLCVSD